MRFARYLITPVVVVAICAIAVAQQPGSTPESTKPTGGNAASEATLGTTTRNVAELQRYSSMVIGMWTVQESHEASDMMPAGSSTGTAIFRNGPGGFSVVENMSLNGSMGKFTGTGITWYDLKDQVYKGTWCDSTTPACDTNFSAEWEGDKLVATGSSQMPGGKKMFTRTEYADITPNSFTFTIYGGPDENSLKKFMTMRYTRKTGPRPATKTEEKKQLR